MSALAYTVICRIDDPQKAVQWLGWLQGGHIDAVIAGGARSAQLVRLDDGKTHEVRYVFPDRAAFDLYLAEHALRLRAEGLAKFPPEDGFHYSRTVGEIVS